jgi:hypothetical protein
MEKNCESVAISGSVIMDKFYNLFSFQTVENKNLWLSLIENAGDSVMNLLTLKDEENCNFWVSTFREQCKRLDELSDDLIRDIEDKISKMDKK